MKTLVVCTLQKNVNAAQHTYLLASIQHSIYLPGILLFLEAK